MKTTLKTLPPELDMNYEETFNSPLNIEIRRKLIPELVKSLKPKHQVSSDQISNWLRSLHRSRRSRNNYRIKGRLDSDNRRLHANGRLNEV
jgi:hypothetical protein